MRILAFDGRMGASGDMLLGALLAVGADRDVLAPVEEAISVRYTVESVDRAGIAATTVTVLHDDARTVPPDTDDGDPDQVRSAEPTDHQDGDFQSGTGTGHDGDSRHDHDHDADHANSHDHPHAEGHGPERTFDEVVDIVEGMGIPETVTRDAIASFRILGEAEAAVHGTDIANTHFHEVGADDAIADVVGVALLLADLAPDRVVTTPLSAGSGEVTMAHGTYPVPPPAVVEIAKRADWSLRGGPVDGELLTPTGAAILAHVADGIEALPPMTVDAVGYGAGTRTYTDRPNVLRATLGEQSDASAGAAASRASGLRHDAITVLETTVDDVAPEVLGGLHETLSEVGARDVAVIPATMKKSRPGHVVQVITKPEDAGAVARRLAEETGTLGVREGTATHRWIADRRVEDVEIEIGNASYDVGVKVATTEDDARYDVSAEFDDAAAVARETGVPVRDVMRRAETAFRETE